MTDDPVRSNEPTDTVSPTEDAASGPDHDVSFREAFWVWVQVAAYSFGGPAGQIGVMHKLLVSQKRWISERRFLHAMNYTMLLPGPEAQQLATYIGWLLHKTKGGIVAGTLFILPGFVSILLLSILYAEFREVTIVEAIFFGLQAAVLAIVVEALLRIGSRALANAAMVAIAAGAFVGIFVFDVLFPIIILAAGLVGFLGHRYAPEVFTVITGHGGDESDEDVAAETPDEDEASPDDRGEAIASDESETEAVISDELVADHERPSGWRAARVAALWGTLWFGPLLGLYLVLGAGHIFTQEGIFFSQVAVVTFGGAYAVLAYIAQEAVATYGWLKPGEMIDGLGMAETTPGPLVQVVQFVGFMGAYRNPGTLEPLVAGILGSVVVTWVTFVPCFLFIFLGAPYIEYLRGKESLTAALSGITAAVVGIILNLAVWFGLHVLFEDHWTYDAYGMDLLVPVFGTLDVAALVIVVGSFVMIFRFEQGMLRTLAAAMAAGLFYHLVVLA
ncbi:chromate transporter [Natronococcus occultus]|uniref:Chromate transport protein ChrA n=1 Tax=Natronococcus occultus SP4 TaxID=694430 RepID=L0K434_9EURY|nr:chromate transporter [Natronococcus occultus]AGB39134.1 chromate transport protein ChrA [Natronococcus occultus SP4]